MLISRAYGVLLHITSLPSDYGVGDLGSWAYRFAGLLCRAGASYWQILPLTPTSLEKGNSPYSSSSTFAGNPLLISPDLLVEEGLLKQDDVSRYRVESRSRADYSYAYRVKEELLVKAYEEFKKRHRDFVDEYERFIEENSYWIEDYALFMVLKKVFGGKLWIEWPREYRDRDPHTLQKARKEFRDKIDFEIFKQFVFYKQWFKLKRYCNSLGIRVIGDIPYYVDLDSADVWTHPELFKLDKEKKPLFVGGVPPDYFSPTGQLWGNPVYDWKKHEETGFEWWIKRLEHALRVYDIVRIDHFRGLIAYWEIPAGSPTAATGKWVEVPYEKFFRVLTRRFPTMPFIAEDLGFITPDVREVIHRYSFPGMKVLVFAFDGSPDNPYLPHNHDKNFVVYTSTHDTNTVRGWFEEEASEYQKKFLFRYLGRELKPDEVSWEFIRLALSSVCRLAVIPLQDILNLGSKARMNRPGTAFGNWEWRVLPQQLNKEIFDKLRELAEIYGRT